MRYPTILAITPLAFFLSGPAVATDVPALEKLRAPIAADDPLGTVAGDADNTGLAAMEAGDADNTGLAAMEAGDATAAPDGESGPQSVQKEEDPGILPGEFSADVALVSDYIFRGITNTNHSPAVQGGLSYTVDVGLAGAQPYVGFWGSNVDFDDGGEASVEIDLMFGFSGTFADLDWNIGGLYYAYPGARSDFNYDYWELPLQMSYAADEHLAILAQYAYSPDFFAKSGNAHYLLAGARWQQPIHSMTLAVEATTGHQWIEDNAAYGAEDYQDWRVALSLTIDKITLGIAYTDTDLDKSQCFGGTNQCAPRVTFSVGASF